MWSRIWILLNPLCVYMPQKWGGHCPPQPLPRSRHPCILAADYLHSTAAGAMHLAHIEDESIHHIEKWVDDLLTHLLSWNFASLHVAFALKFYARCRRFLRCVYCVACVVKIFNILPVLDVLCLCPPCPPLTKSGWARAPRALWFRRLC